MQSIAFVMGSGIGLYVFLLLSAAQAPALGPEPFMDCKVC